MSGWLVIAIASLPTSCVRSSSQHWCSSSTCIVESSSFVMDQASTTRPPTCTVEGPVLSEEPRDREWAYDPGMSHTTAFEDVRRAIEPFGATATLITVNDSMAPHVVTAVIAVADDHLSADVGNSTRKNLLARPSLALVWNPVGDGEYQLILDGAA